MGSILLCVGHSPLGARVHRLAAQRFRTFGLFLNHCRARTCILAREWIRRCFPCIATAACIQSQCSLRRHYYCDCMTVRQLAVTDLSLDMAMRLNYVIIYYIVFFSVPASAVPDNNISKLTIQSCSVAMATLSLDPTPLGQVV